MSRRYTCTSGDYPEHLNPFREDHESDDFMGKNKFNTVGRRKLKAVLNLTSWTGTLFPAKKTKPADKEVTVLQKSSRNKFLTMTPKISRDLMERLSQRTNRSRSSSPATNPAPSRNHANSFSDFTITPKSSREKFARKPNRDEPDGAETASYLWASAACDAASPCSPTTQISEVGTCGDYYDLSEEMKHTKQGAKPKKKRQAPLPPPVSGTTVEHKQYNNTEAEIAEPLVLSAPSTPEPQKAEEPLLSLPEPSPESSMDIRTPDVRGEHSLPT